MTINTTNPSDIAIQQRRVASNNFTRSIENDAIHGNALQQKNDNNDPRAAAYNKTSMRKVNKKIESLETQSAADYYEDMASELGL